MGYVSVTGGEGVCLGMLKERVHLKDQGVDGKNNLK